MLGEHLSFSIALIGRLCVTSVSSLVEVSSLPKAPTQTSNPRASWSNSEAHCLPSAHCELVLCRFVFPAHLKEISPRAHAMLRRTLTILCHPRAPEAPAQTHWAEITSEADSGKRQSNYRLNQRQRQFSLPRIRFVVEIKPRQLQSAKRSIGRTWMICLDRFTHCNASSRPLPVATTSSTASEI